MTALAAASHAARFLIDRQSPDGWWRDYDDLPVGPSDGWVTAYVGRALAAAAAAGVAAAAGPAAQRAAAWLRDVRPYPAGWGYNACSGPDADSTAHALALLRECRIAADVADVAWLRARFRVNGGCATYDRRDAWGVAHIDVTPVAFLALPAAVQAELAGGVRRFIETCRGRDGGWPAYWWRSGHYSTYWNLRALGALGAPPPMPVVLASASGGEDAAPTDAGAPAPAVAESTLSAFDLAFAVGVAALRGTPAGAGLHRLLRQQQSDGSWPGAANLRVTDPRCFRPWEKPLGTLYIDTQRLLTTASALLVLVGTLPAHRRRGFAAPAADPSS